MPTRGNPHGSGRTSVYDPLINPNFPKSMWADCPLAEYAHDPSIGVLLDLNWTSYDAAATTGDWVGTQATAGAAAVSTAAPGVLEVDCSSTTQHQGFQIQRAKSAFLPAVGKDLWFEVNAKVVDTYDKAEIFLGLAELDTTIFASGVFSTNNHIGFGIVTAGAGALKLYSGKAGTAQSDTVATIAEDTYFKVGFRLKLRSSGSTLEAWYNDALVSLTNVVVGTHAPIVAVYPSFLCQTDGTNDPILHLGAGRVFQLR